MSELSEKALPFQPSQSPYPWHQILTSGMQVCVYLGWILVVFGEFLLLLIKSVPLPSGNRAGFGVIINHHFYLECSVHLVSLPPVWSVGTSTICVSTTYFLTFLPVKSLPRYLGEKNMYGLPVHWGKIKWLLVFLSSNQPPMCFLTDGKSVTHKEKQKMINYRTL